MDLKKTKKKLENLQIIQEKVESDKNILLVNMLKLSRKLNESYQNTLNNVSLLNYVIDNFFVSNIFIDSKPRKIIEKLNRIDSKKTLYVFITEEQKHETDSFKRYKEYLAKTADFSKDIFILIGEEAKRFGKENNLNVIYSVSQNVNIDVLKYEISNLIKYEFLNKNIGAVKFVLNSTKIKDKYIQILPIKENNLSNFEESTQEALAYQFSFATKNIKVYPNIEGFVNNEISNYLKNVIATLLFESSFFNEKNKLVHANKLANELDEQIKTKKRKYLQLRREREIEEIMLISKPRKIMGGSRG